MSGHGDGTCGCCSGVRPTTPELVSNRPGLPAVRYRSGTHATFLASLLAGLSDTSRAALRALTTRDADDPTIAFLDGVATVADVLTFYGERIANEAYLRTASESRSVRELARHVGYEPAPGLAAETVLAFTAEEGPGAPTAAPVPAGTAVQSVPGPGERPQHFETVEAVEARAAWNVLRPRAAAAWAPALDDPGMTLEGVATGLAPGDWVLVVGDERAQDRTSERWDARRLVSVTPRPADGVTDIAWDRGLGTRFPPALIRPAAQDPRVFALRRTVSLFGHNALSWDMLPAATRTRYQDGADWPNFTIAGIAGESSVVHLDAHHPEIVPGSWLVLARPPEKGVTFYTELYRVQEASESAREAVGLATPTMRVVLDGEGLEQRFGGHVRTTVALGESEELRPAPVPLTAPVAGRTIALDRRLDPPPPDGRRLVVRGVLATAIAGGPNAGAMHAEAAVMRTASVVGGVTELELDEDLAGSYVRGSVEILANVARATHGKRVDEPLGGGDATVPFPRFALRDGPVTQLGADVPSGRLSTLELWVDGVRWERVDAFFGHGPRERIHTERIEDDGTTLVRAGDGRTGARLPTGRDNLRAVYRAGLGREGNLPAGALSLLMTRPLGIRAVENPLATSGGADPETAEAARERAPLTVLTMERVVSLRDHEDFATTFAGVAKARATWLWGPRGREIHVTVAGPGGDAVPDPGPVHDRLVEAMAQAGDPRLVRDVVTYRPVVFHVRATIGVAPDRDPGTVVDAVSAALAGRFSFAARRLGESIALSEVTAVIHAVAGVEWAVSAFDPAPPVPDRLVAQAPAAGDPTGAAGAQLLTIEVRRGDLVVAR